MFFYSLINMAVIQSRPRDAKPLPSPLSPRCQILPVTSTGPFQGWESYQDPTLQDPGETGEKWMGLRKIRKAGQRS